MIHLQSPKEDKLRQGVTVELFGTGTVTCPIDAFKKWRKVRSGNTNKALPLFRCENGKCYTGNQFNKDIKSLLGQYINYDEKKYLSHSFRAGLASMMASAGYTDAEIMRQGRWHSRNFQILSIGGILGVKVLICFTAYAICLLVQKWLHEPRVQT